MRPQSSYFVFPSIDPTVSLHKKNAIVKKVIPSKFSVEVRVTIFRNM